MTPTYDTRGNLTSAGATTYGYSSENMLISASGGIALSYDPAMRLYQTSGGSSGTTRLAYDGVDLIAEYSGSNAMLRRYVHGPGMDDALVWYEGSGTTDRRFLHKDERGSVTAVTDSSGGVITVNAYDEYGIPKSANLGRFQYTGQTWLPELGMYNYKARIYSPSLGRFLQTDPIGYGDGMNMYDYVGVDPVNQTDPDGTVANFVAGAAIGALLNAGGQVASNMSKGQSFSQAVKNIKVRDVILGAGLGMMGGGMLTMAAATGRVTLIGHGASITIRLTTAERKVAAALAAVGYSPSVIVRAIEEERKREKKKGN